MFKIKSTLMYISIHLLITTTIYYLPQVKLIWASLTKASSEANLLGIMSEHFHVGIAKDIVVPIVLECCIRAEITLT